MIINTEIFEWYPISHVLRNASEVNNVSATGWFSKMTHCFCYLEVSHRHLRFHVCFFFFCGVAKITKLKHSQDFHSEKKTRKLINSNNTVLCIILVLLSNWDTSSYNTKNKLEANKQMNVETASTLALSNCWRFLLTETWQELPLLAQVPVQLCHLLPVFVF